MYMKHQTVAFPCSCLGATRNEVLQYVCPSSTSLQMEDVHSSAHADMRFAVDWQLVKGVCDEKRTPP